jgi:GT2 family glycosyltransferase
MNDLLVNHHFKTLECLKKTENASPQLSIAVRVKNEAAMLPHFLNSLRQQPNINSAEIVFLDSGSTDDTRELILSASLPATLYSIHPSEFSFGATCNLMMTLTSGPHVAFFSGHVILRSPTTLLDAMRYISTLGNISAFFRQVPSVTAGFNAYEQVFLSSAFPEMRNETPLSFRRFSNAASIISRQHWLKVPFPDVIASEDGLWAAQVATLGLPIHYFSKIVIEHSHNESPQQIRKRVLINKIARFGVRKMPLRATASFIKYMALLSLKGEHPVRAFQFSRAHAGAFITQT